MTTRRHLLQSTSAGFGWLAFNALHQQWASAAAPPKTINPLAPKAPHFAAKAKRVIFMFMQGGPSHLDTFDYKPELVKAHEQKVAKYMGTAFDFKPRGKSGLMISDAFPELSLRHHFPFSSLFLHLGSSLPRSSAGRVLKKS